MHLCFTYPSSPAWKYYSGIEHEQTQRLKWIRSSYFAWEKFGGVIIAWIRFAVSSDWDLFGDSLRIKGDWKKELRGIQPHSGPHGLVVPPSSQHVSGTIRKLWWPSCDDRYIVAFCCRYQDTKDYGIQCHMNIGKEGWHGWWRRHLQ